MSADGKPHKWFLVRPVGPGKGYGILDTCSNASLMFREGVSREVAKKALGSYTLEDYRNHWMLANKEGTAIENDLVELLKFKDTTQAPTRKGGRIGR